jgi:hypothetical protein
MILVDTSVWIDHLRAGDARLIELLKNFEVMSHPFVIGEIACGNLENRKEILSLLADLPQVTTATDSEVLFFIEQQQLMGQGIGYIDAHLLASVFLSRSIKLWTQDRRLKKVAKRMTLSY